MYVCMYVCILQRDVFLARSSLHASFAQSLSPNIACACLPRRRKDGRRKKKKKKRVQVLDARSLFVFPVGIRVR